MVHANPNTRLTPTSPVLSAMAWGGLAVVVISMTSLVLFSIYHLLAGVTFETASAAPSRVWLIGVVALVVAAASSVVGFTMGVDPQPRAPEAETDTRRSIAA